MDYVLGLYEKSMPPGLGWQQMLSAGKAAGFDQLEISIDETDARLRRLEWTKEQRLELVRAMAETEMPIRTMCLSAHRKYPLGSQDQHTRERSMEISHKAVELACDLGIRVIQLAGYDVYYEKSVERTREQFAENLKKCVDDASRYGVCLGFETMETPFMDAVHKAMTYVRQISSPYLGVYPDLGNLTNACRLYDLNIDEEIRAGRGHTYAMHLKETQKDRYRDMDFGTGWVDFAGGIRQAQHNGVHMFTAEFWYNGAEGWQNRLAEANRYIRSQFAAIG